MTRRFHIITFGCQMNVYDTRRLSMMLLKDGWEEAKDSLDADFIFLNTCSIREKAQKKVIARLRELLPLKRRNPSLILGVGGCVAEQEGKQLLQKIPELNLIIGPGKLTEIPALLRSNSTSSQSAIRDGFVYDDGLMDSLIYPRGDGIPSPLTSFISIMEGCNNFCAYCVVPFVRGRERSREPSQILDEANILVANGAKEITLLGQNVNSYKPSPATFPEASFPFAELLREMSKISGLKRLRFISPNPKDFPKELIDLFKEIDILASHVHLPLQAASNRILKLMGRGYTFEKFLSIVEGLRANRCDIAITTDIIVGFPGETDEEFQETLSAVEKIRFDSIFSFAYSDRPQTRAEKFPDKIPSSVKASRLEELIKVQKAISTDVNQRLLGSTLEVLIEGSGRVQGQLSGRSGSNKIVHFMGSDELIGEMLDIRITRAGPVSLQGELDNPKNFPKGSEENLLPCL